MSKLKCSDCVHLGEVRITYSWYSNDDEHELSFYVEIYFLFSFLVTDIDNNGFLDQNDFECMALRACIIEGKGDCNPAKLSEFQHIMRSLWDEISDLADFDKVWKFYKNILSDLRIRIRHAWMSFNFLFFQIWIQDGRISNDEFKEAVQKTCVGKKYDEFPQVSVFRVVFYVKYYLTMWLQAMKAFIEANFKMIDIDGDGIVGAKEFRYNCITRIAVENIQVVDDAFNKLLDVSFRKHLSKLNWN